MRYLILILLLALPAAAQTRISGARILEKASNHATLTSVGTDSYTATLGTGTSQLKSYSEGNVYSFIADVANSGSATLDINGIGAVTIIRRDGSGLQNGDLSAGEVVTVRFDATNRFQLQGPSGSQTVPPHATTHQDGGADEVATVTPAAGAIPKADTGGQLAIGFLPQIPTSQVDFPEVAGSPQLDLAAVADIYMSAGTSLGGAISDAGAGSIDVSGGAGIIRIGPNDDDPLFTFTWPASNGLSIPLTQTRYVIVEYNAGTPQVALRTSPDYNMNSEISLGSATNDAGEMRIASIPWLVSNGVSRLIDWMDGVIGYERDRLDGGVNVTANGVNVQRDEGSVWVRMIKYIIPALDTSGADTFDIYYRDGASGFTKVTNEVLWPDAQYDDGSGTLANLNVNRYGTLWWYVDIAGNQYMLYGYSNVRTIAEARSEPQPLVPAFVGTQAGLIGRWVIREGDAAPTLAESYFDRFSADTITFHGQLSGRSEPDQHPASSITGGSSYTEGTAAPPATCTVGAKYLRTDTDEAFQCTSTNTWTETTGGGGGGGLGDPGADGIVVRTALNTTIARSLAAGVGILITFPDGVFGDPLIDLDGTVAALQGQTNAFASPQRLGCIATPGSNPPADNLDYYCKDDAGTMKMAVLDPAGTETVLGAGGGGGTKVLSTGLGSTGNCNLSDTVVDSYTIPAAELAVGDVVTIEAIWDHIGTASGPRPKIFWGGTQIINSVSIDATETSARTWATVGITGATAQVAWGEHQRLNTGDSRAATALSDAISGTIAVEFIQSTCTAPDEMNVSFWRITRDR